MFVEAFVDFIIRIIALLVFFCIYFLAMPKLRWNFRGIVYQKLEALNTFVPVTSGSTISFRIATLTFFVQFYPSPMMTQWPSPNFMDLTQFATFNGLNPTNVFKPTAGQASQRYANGSNNANSSNHPASSASAASNNNRK